MLITLNNTRFKNFIEILEQHEINKAISGSEVITINPFGYTYEIRLEEETVTIKSRSRNIEAFFNKIHKVAEIRNREYPGGKIFSLKDIIEKEFDVKLEEV